MPFRDRSDAGRKLERALSRYEAQHPVILALPCGGAPVAAEAAAALYAPLDLILVRKIGVPMQPELAMGAVVDGTAPIIVRNDDIIRRARISESEFRRVCDLELAEITRRRRYLGGRPPVDVKGPALWARPHRGQRSYIISDFLGRGRRLYRHPE